MKAARECGEDEFELQDLDEYYGIWLESLNCRDSQVNAVERNDANPVCPDWCGVRVRVRQVYGFANGMQPIKIRFKAGGA